MISMVKAKISSKEAMHRLDTGNGMIELKVKRDKEGKVIESVGYFEVDENEFQRLKSMGEKAGFSVSKSR